MPGPWCMKTFWDSDKFNYKSSYELRLEKTRNRDGTCTFIEKRKICPNCVKTSEDQFCSNGCIEQDEKENEEDDCNLLCETVLDSYLHFQYSDNDKSFWNY